MNTIPQPELIPMGPGDILRQAREKHRWTVELMAQTIKVRPEVLRSIEKGDTSHIPPVYLKGYIRSYAREVGIAENVIDQCLSHARGADPAVQSVFKASLPRNKGDRWFKASSYVLASAVVIALVWQFTNEAVRFSQGDPVLRSSQTENSTSLPSRETVRDSGAGADFATETLPAKTHLRASIASMSGTQEQISSNRPLVAEGAWAAIGNRDTAADRPDTALAEIETLEIATSADSWVEILDRHDKKIERELVRAGSRRTYRGAAPFRLLIGRASSVEVFHNGEKVNLAPYIRGNVARLSLGRDEPVAEPAANLDAESPAVDTASPGQG